MTSHELHHAAASPLLLPNAWDVPSALAFLDAGFTAIGTTSFGVASSLGRPDGGRATRDANLALARALSSLPAYISIDIEDGYDDDRIGSPPTRPNSSPSGRPESTSRTAPPKS